MAAPKGNKYALGHGFGRPKKIDTPQQLEKLLIRYFQACDNEGKKYTTTGLALYLGYSKRQSLYDIAKHGDDFSVLIEKALLRIEQMYEERLQSPAVAGSIFALSNMGWKNRQGVEISDPQGNALPAPQQNIQIGIDYSKLPAAALQALMEARTNTQAIDSPEAENPEQ